MILGVKSYGDRWYFLFKRNVAICTESRNSLRSIFPQQHPFNTLRPRQNGRRFANDTFKRIFLNENVRISITISLKFVPKGPNNNNPALVQIMAWRRPGDKPLSKPRMESLLTHICVTRPQWVKVLKYKRICTYPESMDGALYFTLRKVQNGRTPEYDI